MISHRQRTRRRKSLTIATITVYLNWPFSEDLHHYHYDDSTQAAPAAGAVVVHSAAAAAEQSNLLSKQTLLNWHSLASSLYLVIFTKLLFSE